MAFTFEKKKDTETGLLFISLFYIDEADAKKNITITVAPEYGSNIVQFRVGDKEVFYTDKELIKQGKWTGCYVLWPLPNRYLRDGKKEFEFESRIVSLEDIHRKEGNPPLIHGLVDDQNWEYTEPEISQENVKIATSIEINEQSPLFKHFPYKSKLQLTFTLNSTGLVVTYAVTNKDDKNLPSVFALHPYYRLLDGREDTFVHIPANEVMEATEELLPTGKFRDVDGSEYDLRYEKPVKDMWFDDVWTNLNIGEYPYVLYRKSGLRISTITTDDFTHAVLYTQMEKEKGFICMEPQTGSTNAINLHDQAVKENDEDLLRLSHVIIVEPGNVHEGKIKFEVEHLAV